MLYRNIGRKYPYKVCYTGMRRESLHIRSLVSALVEAIKEESEVEISLCVRPNFILSLSDGEACHMLCLRGISARARAGGGGGRASWGGGG